MSEKIILVIEDQKSMAGFLQEKLSQKTDLSVLVASTMAEAVEIIDSGVKIAVCLTDLNLPDAEEGATVPMLRKNHITTVVLTVNYTEKTRKKMFDLQVADYVIKDGPAALDYAVNICLTMVENSKKAVWLVSKPGDNSVQLRHLLSNQGYRVFVFERLEEMSKAINGKAPDLIVLNQVMEFGDEPALKLVQLIRYFYSSSQLPIILTDTSANVSSCIKLMKYGVNDFFNIETSAEEFYVRLRLNMLQAERYKEIERISQTDGLTGLYNMRYFFKHCDEFFIQNHLEHHFAVMLDIDHFKRVNDTYGHKKGDEAIQFTARQINQVFDKYLVARFGGEEFCICGSCQTMDEILDLSERLRQLIANGSEAATGVAFTVSIGVNFNAHNVSKGVAFADEALYEAKETGRNKVVVV